MIKLLLSMLLIILILVFFWKNIFLNEPKKKIKENFVATDFAQPNNKNKNMQKLEEVYDKVNPCNFYTQNYNTPNFVSNVLDLRKFYAYDLPPNSPEKSLPIPTEPINKNPFPAPIVEKFDNYPPSRDFIIKDKEETMPWYIKDKNTPSGLEYQSDYWVYKNEMPMNGGLFGNIVGYENMGSSFSLFYDKNTADIVQDQEAYLKPDDDLRNGMGTPQKQKYLYNMSNP